MDEERTLFTGRASQSELTGPRGKSARSDDSNVVNDAAAQDAVPRYVPRSKRLGLAIGQLHDESLSSPLGTAFAVTSKLAVTCWHCVRRLDHAEGGTARVIVRIPRDINEHWEESHCPATVVDSDPTIDLALLEFDSPLPDHLRPIALLILDKEEVRQRWHSVAWPAQFGRVDGLPLSGDISGFALDSDQPTLVLEASSAGAAAPLDERGASGAPALVSAGATTAAVGVLRRVELDPESRSRAIGGLTFAVPAAQVVRRWGHLIPAENPFQPPLRRFGAEDASRFYGRTKIIRSLRRELAEPGTRHITLIGASGTGKSSLVRAGLIGQRDRVRSVPLALRWDHVCVIDSYEAGCVGRLDEFSRMVGDAAALLVFDQFEQILHGGEAERVRLHLARLLETCRAATVIFLVRTDYLGEFEKQAASWFAFIYAGIRHEIKLDVSREELREMCLEPAKAAGITFEVGLVNTIVEGLLEAHSQKVADKHLTHAPPTILPLLGITMWRLAHGLGVEREISQQMYEEIGGIRGALAGWANQAFSDAVATLTKLDEGEDPPDGSTLTLKPSATAPGESG
jgi:hypothetical protein